MKPLTPPTKDTMFILPQSTHHEIASHLKKYRERYDKRIVQINSRSKAEAGPADEDLVCPSCRESFIFGNVCPDCDEALVGESLVSDVDVEDVEAQGTFEKALSRLRSLSA